MEFNWAAIVLSIIILFLLINLAMSNNEFREMEEKLEETEIKVEDKNSTSNLVA